MIHDIGVVSATQNMECLEIQVLKKKAIISISWKHLEEVGFMAILSKFQLPIYFHLVSTSCTKCMIEPACLVLCRNHNPRK